MIRLFGLLSCLLALFLLPLNLRLFSDAMGPSGTYRGTYIGMIDHNATVIARELGGNAPEGGFQGKLTEDRK